MATVFMQQRSCNYRVTKIQIVSTLVLFLSCSYTIECWGTTVYK